MAIPTQFSVTSTRSSPIANPESPKDLPRIIDAENQSIVDGANILASLSSVGVDSPDNITAQPSASIDTSVTIPALSAGSVGAPSELAALTLPSIDTPDELTALASPSVDTPSNVSAQAQATTPAPSIVTPNAGTAITPPFPLRNPRILYDNALLSYDSITSTEGVPVNAIAPNTWQKWEFDSTATNSAILVRLPEAVTMDTICIGAHNLGSIAATVSITYSTDGVAFVDWEPDFTVSEDTAIMSYIETPRQVKAIQIFVLNGVEGLGVIGYISAGEALQMQRPIFNGHTPITDADVTEYYANRTESGEIINQDIRLMGYQSSADFSNLDDTWYRTYFAPFKQSAKKLPYFFAWNLDEYPQDVGLCRASSDMSAPMQNGTRTKRSVSIPLLGAG